MPEGLKIFIACLIAAIIVIVITWILFKYNPIWRNYMLSYLEVGEIRWCTPGSIKRGPNHRFVVVTAIDKKKKKISYDEYIIDEFNKPKLNEANKVWSVADFFRFTQGEPFYKEYIDKIYESK